MTMKPKIIAVISLFLFVIICCHKENSNEYKSDGIITGADIRACACCGGWFIKIDSILYEFDTLPDNSDINLEKETFPVYVKLDWQLATGYCPGNKIIIKRIKKEQPAK
jgi:hypothetical protein